jgi:hypothetical protein
MAPMTLRIWLPSIVIATTLFAFVVFGQLEFSFDFLDTGLWGLFCLALLVTTLVTILVRAARKRWGSCLRSAFVLLSLVAALFTGFLIQHHQVERSQELAEPIIAALEVYRTEHGRYPDQLQALVPGYVNAIPTPRLGLSTARPLDYSAFADDTYLLFFPAFAFMDAMYSSDTGTWVLDD